MLSINQSSFKIYCSLVRHKSIVIRQIDTKLSRAEKVKKNNFETKNLFGSKIKKKAIKSQNEQEVKSNGKSIASEIYWISQQPTEVKQKKDLNQTTKDEKEFISQKNKKKIINSAQDVRNLSKINSNMQQNIPEAFRSLATLPKPVKVTIKDALDDLDSQINSIDFENDYVKNEIPFNQVQLHNISNFPLTIQSNDLILNAFDETAENKIQPNLIPSVSKILQATMPLSSRTALLQWKNLKIAELGLDGFEELQQSHLSRGKKFHECIQRYFSGIKIDDTMVPPDIQELWKSIESRLSEFKSPAILTEEKIHHPFLCYKGIVDCISIHDNVISVIEWKKSDKIKSSVSSTFDAPLQLVAYLGAINSTTFYKNPITKGVITVAYDGHKADLFQLNENELNRYWKVWLNRLQEYWIRYRDNTLTNETI